MSSRLHRFAPRTADALFGVAQLTLIALLVERAIAGAWQTAVVLAIVVATVAIVRLRTGPLVGPALVEVTAGELILTSPFYIPARTQKLRLESLQALRLAGPTGDRRFRFSLVDGSTREFRPCYGLHLEPRVVDFLKTALPETVSLVEEEPPGLLSRMRGDF